MYFKCKRVLVTGGTGSFGQLAVRRLLEHDAREVRVFSRSEKKQWKMKRSLQDERVTYVLGDIRDLEAVRSVIRDIDIVFHAAALKYVPQCEYNVLETVHINILGSVNLIKASKEARVRTLVALSSDKAVQPVNAYGMTKALMERLLINANLDLGGFPTKFISVRYGNVIGSSGSVIPFFKEQIAQGGPVTVTHPNMTRFWFSLDQAVELAFNSAVVGIGGEVFVPKIPSSTMQQLAEVLVGDRDIEIETIGVRPGEKIHEWLVSGNETPRTIDCGPDGYIILPELPVPGIASFYGDEAGIAQGYSSSHDVMNDAELAALLESAGWL